MHTRALSGQTVWDYCAMALTVGLVLLSSTILLLRANGYTIDFDRFQVQQVGLLVVQPDTNDLVFTINGQTAQELNEHHELLREPGRLRLQATRALFRPWQKDLTMTPGQANVVSGLRLFPLEPTTTIRPATNEELHIPLLPTELVVQGRELYRTGRNGEAVYVTRFSLPIRSATWLDGHHIAYQIGKKVHVMDADGTNDVLIYSVLETEPLRLYSLQRGNVLGVVIGATTTEIDLSAVPSK